MKILIIHQNFPGQFKNIAQYLANHTDHQVLAIGKTTAPGLKGIKLLRYTTLKPEVTGTNFYLNTFEAGAVHGEAVASILRRLHHSGYRPDVVLAHPGWGESIFVKDIYPETKLIHFCEYYYHSEGADADFDPEFKISQKGKQNIRTKNALHLLNLENCDVGITPTKWQHSLHPIAYHSKIIVAHEGVSTSSLMSCAEDQLILPCGKILKRGAKVITYVARNLEPHRGFHTFMRSLPLLLQMNTECEVLVVGGDGVSYGRRPTDYSCWREKMTRENGFDKSRVHFLGKVPYGKYATILKLSSIHIYLTYPFVLSWSFLEAMATGCLVVASDTKPVREVISDNVNGLLVNFFDSEQLARKICDCLDDLQSYQHIKAAAVRSAKKYSDRNGVARYMAIINSVSRYMR